MVRKDKFRFWSAVAVISIAALVVLIRYASIMLWNERSSTTVVSQALVERGPILDREGRILAIQTRFESVTAWIPDVKDAQAEAAILSKILERDIGELEAMLSSSTDYRLIERKVSESEADEIRDFLERDELPGISLETEYGRSYPGNDLAAHVLGFVGVDNVGLDGIEFTYDAELSPTTAESNAETIYGNQLFLTIDLNIQHMAERIAEDAYESYDADSVMLLVMDAKAGEFLAYASYPTYDPNTYNDFEQSGRLNRPSHMAYEPGSVFKVFSMSSFLELEAIGLNDSFYCPGYYEHDDIQGRINCLGVHYRVNPAGIIKYSCNAGAAYASEGADSEDFHRMIEQFGFGDRTHLPFPGESYGILAGPENWSSRSKPTLAFGQEVAATAAQVITAATVFANQGTLLRPHIVKRIVSPEGKIIKEFTREPVRKVLGNGTATTMLRMMELATEDDGTARRAAVEGLRISAKTGTAQLYDPETGGYSENAFVASCLALMPTNDPSIIIYVVLEHPKGDEYYGGRIAAPLVRQMTEELVNYLDIPLVSDGTLDHPGKVTVPTRKPPIMKETMPNLVGYSKRELLTIIADTRFSVVVDGEGWVVEQSPAPGSQLTDGMTINLKLE